MEQIIVAGIGLLGSVVVALITYAGVIKNGEVSRKAMDQQLGIHQAVTDEKIETLTREVREHNAFAKRMPVLEEKVSVLNHRVADIEEALKHE